MGGVDFKDFLWEALLDPAPGLTMGDTAERVALKYKITREEVDRCPPEFAARSYANLSYGLAPTGGHFLAAEEPALLAQDIRKYFREYR